MRGKIKSLAKKVSLKSLGNGWVERVNRPLYMRLVLRREIWAGDTYFSNIGTQYTHHGAG